MNPGEGASGPRMRGSGRRPRGCADRVQKLAATTQKTRRGTRLIGFHHPRRVKPGKESGIQHPLFRFAGGHSDRFWRAPDATAMGMRARTTGGRASWRMSSEVADLAGVGYPSGWLSRRRREHAALNVDRFSGPQPVGTASIEVGYLWVRSTTGCELASDSSGTAHQRMLYMK
jgi:hypothetical protein